MGGDGGCLPTRVDLVKTAGYRYARNLGGMGYSPNLQIKSGDDKLTPKEIGKIRLTHCALSQSPLAPPIVVCRIGLLYNKEEVIKYLLSKKKIAGMRHIRSLKDVKDIMNRNIQPSSSPISFVCPVTHSELSNTTRGIMIWCCGCIISEKAFKQYVCMDSDNKTSKSIAHSRCPSCDVDFKFNPSINLKNGQIVSSGDIIVIAPDGSTEALLRLKYKFGSQENRKQKDTT